MENLNWLTVMPAIAAVLVPAGGFALWAVKTIMQGEHAKLLTQINGTYIRAQHATLTGAEIERVLTEIKTELEQIHEIQADLKVLKNSLTELNSYAHRRIHDLANAVAPLSLLAQRYDEHFGRRPPPVLAP